jgi:hypothetical protein
MPVHKKDTSLGRRHLKNFVVFGVPFALACMAAIFAHRHQRTDWFIAAFVVGFVIALIGLIRQERLFRRYRCPQCGSRLVECPRKNGQPIEFFCQHCDIIWDSGFTESDVSGG